MFGDVGHGALLAARRASCSGAAVRAPLGTLPPRCAVRHRRRDHEHRRSVSRTARRSVRPASCRRSGSRRSTQPITLLAAGDRGRRGAARRSRTPRQRQPLARRRTALRAGRALRDRRERALCRACACRRSACIRGRCRRSRRGGVVLAALGPGARLRRLCTSKPAAAPRARCEAGVELFDAVVRHRRQHRVVRAAGGVRAHARRARRRSCGAATAYCVAARPGRGGRSRSLSFVGRQRRRVRARGARRRRAGAAARVLRALLADLHRARPARSSRGTSRRSSKGTRMNASPRRSARCRFAALTACWRRAHRGRRRRRCECGGRASASAARR